MTSRRKQGLVIVLLVGFGLTLALIWWGRSGRPVEPVYQGLPLSHWIQTTFGGTNSAAGRQALRAMGPEAAQYFFDSIDTSPGDTLVRKAYRSIRERLPFSLRQRTPKPRIDELVWMHDVAGYLNLIAPEAHEQVLAACIHPNPKVRYTAVMVTPQLGPWRASAVPVLAGRLADPDSNVRIRAVEALERMQADKSAALSALLEVIQSHRQDFTDHTLAKAVTVLGNFGPQAIEAAPRLTEFMRSSNTVLRVESAVALWKIDRNTNALACLVSEIRNPGSEQDILWTLLVTLGDMGPAAQPFAPALREKSAAPPGTNSPAWLPTQLQIAINRITITNPPRPTVKPLRPAPMHRRP